MPSVLPTSRSSRPKLKCRSRPTPRVAPRVEVRNLSFRYADGEPWVLRDFDLTIEAGESVAIVGASGCGKTTLLKLLLGLNEPVEGEIRIGAQGARFRFANSGRQPIAH